MNYMRISHDPVMRMLLNNFMNQEQETERKCRWMPATNVTEDDQAFHLEMAIPGHSKEDFKINLEKDILTISAEREKSEINDEQKQQAYRLREFGPDDFCRSFSLPEAIDNEAITAEYLNGILMITLPKKEVEKMTKEIKIT